MFSKRDFKLLAPALPEGRGRVACNGKTLSPTLKHHQIENHVSLSPSLLKGKDAMVQHAKE